MGVVGDRQPGPVDALNYVQEELFINTAALALRVSAYQVRCSCGWVGYARPFLLPKLVEDHFRTWVGGDERLISIDPIYRPLQEWRDHYYGVKRCFILGAGPSINAIPHDLRVALRDEVTWGVNYVMQCVGDWLTPTYYACSEPEELKLLVKELSHYDMGKSRLFYAHSTPIVGYNNWQWVPRDNDLRTGGGHLAGGRANGTFGWASNGGTVVIDVCVQVAAYMGCNPIYLLGMDGAGGHCHPEIHEPDREDGSNAPTQSIIEHVQGAAKALAKRGVRLINLTEGDGVVDLGIERGRLAEVLGVK